MVVINHVNDDRSTTQEYVTDAAECIYMKLVINAEGLKDGAETNSFHPEFTHQFFGESETIFGFKDLKVLIYYAASSLDIYFSVQYSDKLVVKKPDDLKPDNVEQIIREQLPPDSHTSLDSFSVALQEQSSFKPFGELVHAYNSSNKRDTDGCFEIYMVKEPSEEFLQHFERMETFCLWYIDAASYIDTDDARWKYFVIYQKQKDPTGSVFHTFVGYAVVYEYFAYPEHIRPRVAQILVLPPFQKCGHGVNLLQTIYKEYRNNSKVIDITAEDPSDNYILLRDYVDCFNCLSLASFQPQNLKQGFSASMAHEARQRLKIPTKQARRVYEILRLKETTTDDPVEFKAYRLDIKNRLNKPFQKSQRDFIKLRKALHEDELTAALHSLTPEQRITQLQKQFEQTVETYRYTINRLKSCQA